VRLTQKEFVNLNLAAKPQTAKRVKKKPAAKKKFAPKKFEVLLPYPPSVNHAYRVYAGRVLISETGRNYQKTVFFEVAQSGITPELPFFGDDRLRVSIFVYPPDNRQRDLDNLGKLLLDGMEKAGVYKNDSQIDNLTFIRCWVEKPGHVKVLIRNLKPVGRVKRGNL